MNDWKRANTDWFMEAAWGVFVHYFCDLWDVPVSVDGRIPENFLAQLSAIGR